MKLLPNGPWQWIIALGLLALIIVTLTILFWPIITTAYGDNLLIQTLQGAATATPAVLP